MEGKRSIAYFFLVMPAVYSVPHSLHHSLHCLCCWHPKLYPFWDLLGENCGIQKSGDQLSKTKKCEWQNNRYIMYFLLCLSTKQKLQFNNIIFSLNFYSASGHLLYLNEKELFLTGLLFNKFFFFGYVLWILEYWINVNILNFGFYI